MPLFLGATVKPSPNESAGVGLYYQWGRKDPLGRIASFSSSSNSVSVVTDQYPSGSSSFFTDASNIVADDDVLASYQEASEAVQVRHIIDFTIKNPTKYITSLYLQNDDPYLWGNPLGTTYPSLSKWNTKSVFDPCPEGYRVGPQDLYVNFTMGYYGMSLFDAEKRCNSLIFC